MVSEFWSQKPNNVISYETVTFDHPDIDMVSLVANQFDPVTLGGVEFTPVTMQVRMPNQSTDPVASVSVSFPRAVVGDAFKQALKQITPYNRIIPITMTVQSWLSSDPNNPQYTWDLFIGEDGITMSSDTIQISGADDNPMVLGVSTIYDPAVFTGLDFI